MRSKGAVIILAVFLLSVCIIPWTCRRGPASTRTNSAAFDSLAQKVAYLEQYVSFRRTYESLDFDLFVANHSGGLVPGPSNWDIRLVATVPQAEIDGWVPEPGQTPEVVPDLDWLATIPTKLDLSGVDEWYHGGGRTVGLDRDSRIVVYRLLRF